MPESKYYNPSITIHYTKALDYIGSVGHVRADFERTIRDFYLRHGIDEVRIDWSEDGDVCFARPKMFEVELKVVDA